jgi:hypothetical protein
MIVINTIEEFNILPKGVKTLTFGDCFNQKINIPNSVLTLNIYKNFNEDVFIPLNINVKYYN